MADPITVSLSEHQKAFFAGLFTEEQAAKRIIELTPYARSAAIKAIVAQQYDPAILERAKAVDVNHDTGVITVTPSE